MSRTTRVIAALAVASAVGTATPAHGQVALEWTSAWTAPADEPAPIAAPTPFTGWFRYGPDGDSTTVWTIDGFTLNVAIADGATLPEGCPMEALAADVDAPAGDAGDGTRASTGVSGSTADDTDPDRRSFAFTDAQTTPVCNGTYTASVVAHASRRDPAQTADAPPLTRTLLVAIPPPPVTEVSVRGNRGGAVTLTWNAPEGYAVDATASPGAAPPPDFAGYQVERADGNDGFHTIGTTEPDTLVFADTEAGSTGLVSYRVRAMRAGATADAPALSDDTQTATVEVDLAARAVNPSASGSGSSGGGGGTTHAAGPPTTVEVQPESDLEPGDPDPVLPDDASELGGPIVTDVGDDGAGRAVLVPVAVGIVLLVWAMHLRYLTHQATRVA